MRNKGLICILIVLALLVCPVAAMGEKTDGGDGAGHSQNAEEPAGKDGDTILVLSSSTDKVSEIDMFEYVVGAVAAEMPATYHSEALKAQAAACYTYALKTRESQLDDPDSSLGGAHISDSSASHQGYIDDAARRKKWGDKYESYENKIEKAVKDVFGKKITYNGELITAAFHAISPGQTLSAEEVWGMNVPYLQSVLSAGDKLSPDYSRSVVISEKQFEDGAAEIQGVTISGKAEAWVGEIEKNKNGYVTGVEICGKTVTGAELRSALGLRSAAFEIEYSDTSFKISTLGYGHGVGMSQYGADYMARQGSSWEEILKHYYTGAEIES